MYMRAHGSEMPGNDQVRRGDVKTPPLWHTAAKAPFARWYCDGSFHASLPLMASSMELELDQSFDKLVTSVLPTIKRDFETVIRHLRPPRYPYAIDHALAAKGKALFYADEIGCAKCHGVHDENGGVQWTGMHMDVGTDRARIEVVTDGFIDAFNRSPLAAEGRLEASAGYAATPLTGVWANYPYLHNGSVPTLHHLLGPVSERPRLFSVRSARAVRPSSGSASDCIRTTGSGGGVNPSVSKSSVPTRTGSMRAGRVAATRVTISGRGSDRTPTARR